MLDRSLGRGEILNWGGQACSMCAVVSFFFFSSRRRHTRFDCDWSSDVCSSDLFRSAQDAINIGRRSAKNIQGVRSVGQQAAVLGRNTLRVDSRHIVAGCERDDKIGRGSCRGRGEISVGGGSLKKKKKKERDRGS